MMLLLPLSNRPHARDSGAALARHAPLRRRCARRLLQALTLTLLALAAWLIGPDGAAAAAEHAAAPVAAGHHAPPGTFALHVPPPAATLAVPAAPLANADAASA
jgi:hypothetical protein